ncbi:MAG: thioredoxin-dependent thiol peroxidase [Verrucomicrobiota bacterium]
MAELKVGNKAPALTALNQSGEKVSLQDFAGQRVVLYFYPKDDTPGCTKEACAFRDNHKAFASKNTVILGVSPDAPQKHEKFITKYNLPFTLLADEDHAISEKYGVWVEKSMYGKQYMGVERSTFVIDVEGKLEAIYHKVKPEPHVMEVLESL